MSRRLDRSGRPARQARARRLNLEVLEGRALMATIPPVTTALDNGNNASPTPGSLRAAIIALNADTMAGADSISFNIPGSGGAQTIALQAALPTITHAVALDGTTQTGYLPNMTPLIVIDGSATPAGSNGLTLAGGASGSILRGLAIVGFGSDASGAGGDGIALIGASGSDQIFGCYLGVGADGSTIKANENGIAVQSPNNTIGGPTAMTRNVLSGNTNAGVLISGTAAAGNVVTGDYIGTNATGSAAAGNLYGVEVMASNNTIGGTAAGAGNLISGNVGPTAQTGSGILLQGVATNNLIAGNKIGTNAQGTAALLPTAMFPSITYSNTYGIYFGSQVDTSGDNLVQETVGGQVAGSGNLISGNFVGITGNIASSLIQGNTIGLDAAGTAPIANGAGIVLGANLTTIGGTVAGARNVISGSSTVSGTTGTGLQLSGDRDVIAGNYVGVASTGLAGPSTGNVVGMDLNLTNSAIGSTTPGIINLISGNTGDAIRLTGNGGDSFASNIIGLNIQGNPDPNLGNGIVVTIAAPTAPPAPTTPFALNDMIGNTALGTSNTIAFSGGAGILVHDNYPTGITGLSIRGNSIFANAKLGLDLQGNGVPTPSTLFLNGYSVTNGRVIVSGVYFAAPGTSVSVDLFANGSDASGFGQGAVYLGSVNLTTNLSGFAFFTPNFASPTPAFGSFSATVTDTTGNTSDFAENLPTPANLPVANLVVQSTSASTPLVVGSSVTLVEKIFNLGPNAAINTVAYDSLPTSLVNTSVVTTVGTASLDGNNVLSANLGTLPAFTFATLTITGVVSQAGTFIDQPGASSTTFDPNYLDNAAQQSLVVGQGNSGPTADLAIVETASPTRVLANVPVTYTINVGNIGPNVATNATVTDFLPAGATLVGISASQGGAPSINGTFVTLNLGTLAPGALATITIVVTPRSAGSITNAANVSGNQYDPVPSNNSTSLTLPVSNATPSIHFAIAQTVYPTTGAIGVFQAFTISAANLGPDIATDVVVIDNLPANVAFYSAQASQGNRPLQANGAVSVNFGTLAPGGIATIQIIVIPSAIGTLTNVAGVYTPDVASVAPAYSSASFSVVAGPSVTSIVGFGGNAQLVLNFNEDLNPFTATNPANYVLVAMGKIGKGPNKTISIASVTYNAVSRSVMLLPAQALDPTQYYKITVIGSSAAGVTDTYGRRLAGSLYGPAGGDFSAVIFAGSLPQR